MLLLLLFASTSSLPLARHPAHFVTSSSDPITSFPQNNAHDIGWGVSSQVAAKKPDLTVGSKLPVPEILVSVSRPTELRLQQVKTTNSSAANTSTSATVNATTNITATEMTNTGTAVVSPQAREAMASNWWVHARKCSELSKAGCAKAPDCAWTSSCERRVDVALQALKNTPAKCHQQEYVDEMPNKDKMGTGSCTDAAYCFVLAQSNDGVRSGRQGCLTHAEFLQFYADNDRVRPAPGCYYWDSGAIQSTLCVCNQFMCNTPDLWRT